jgi:hypothetical protein
MVSRSYIFSGTIQYATNNFSDIKHGHFLKMCWWAKTSIRINKLSSNPKLHIDTVLQISICRRDKTPRTREGRREGYPNLLFKRHSRRHSNTKFESLHKKTHVESNISLKWSLLVTFHQLSVENWLFNVALCLRSQGVFGSWARVPWGW